jgi:hypothetical protein
MAPPVSKAHPAEIVFAVVTLHVVASPVLLNAYVALGAILCVGRDVIGSFAIVCALGQPPFDCVTVGGSMVGVPTFEAKSGLTGSTDCVLGDTLLSFDHNGAVGTRAKPQVGMTPDIVEEAKVDVAFPNLRFRHLRKDQVLSAENLTGRRHAGEGGGDSKRYLGLAVHLPALGAEAVLAALGRCELGLREVEGTDRAVELLEGRYVRDPDISWSLHLPLLHGACL